MTILKSFTQFSNQFGFQPTFPVTASVVNRHPAYFQQLQREGVELAVHGFLHVDYTQLPETGIINHYNRAVQIFKEQGLNPSGFRFPFLRRNKITLELLAESGIQWDSSDVISWPFDRPAHVDASYWKRYHQILETYQAQSIRDVPSLPKNVYGLIEIPVSVPDDDILFERLKVSPATAGSIWGVMLEEVRNRHELLTLQLHPERFPLFKGPLRSVVLKARSFSDCWIASLGQISDWWREKDQFQYKITQTVKGQFDIEFICSGRGQPQVSQVNPDGRKFWVPCEKQSRVQSIKRPLIGLSPSNPENLKKFLADELIIFEITENSDSTNLYIDWQGAFHEKHKRPLLDQIQSCKDPLIRYGRWPKPSTFCLAITGDIDGMDLWDYWSRFYGRFEK